MRYEIRLLSSCRKKLGNVERLLIVKLPVSRAGKYLSVCVLETVNRSFLR